MVGLLNLKINKQASLTQARTQATDIAGKYLIISATKHTQREPLVSYYAT